jgi:lysophospholipase L1-like esterase
LAARRGSGRGRRPGRHALAALASLGTAAAIVLAGPAIAHADGTDAPTYHEYVALGDSYTSSSGFTNLPDTRFVPLGCAQSTNDYPHQVARLLDVDTFTDASCGGATTDDFTGAQSVLGSSNAPQFDRLTATTDLVTIGIGGNDVGLVGLATTCIEDSLTGKSCKKHYTSGGTDQISAKIAAAEPKLEAAIDGVRARSPQARIVLVNYLDAVPDNGTACFPRVPILSNTDMAWFTAKFKEMNAMLATSAAGAGADLADTYTPTIGHDACKAPTTRYVEPLTILSLNPVGSLSVPLHPNVSGANAQSQIVFDRIRQG